MLLKNAQKKIEYGKKEYYNYYPQEKENIQLMLDATRDRNNIKLDNMFFHHTSSAI